MSEVPRNLKKQMQEKCLFTRQILWDPYSGILCGGPLSPLSFGSIIHHAGQVLAPLLVSSLRMLGMERGHPEPTTSSMEGWFDKNIYYIRGNQLLSPLKFGNQSPSADSPCMFSDICSVQDVSRVFRTTVFVSIIPFGNRFLTGKCWIKSGPHITQPCTLTLATIEKTHDFMFPTC